MCVQLLPPASPCMPVPCVLCSALLIPLGSILGHNQLSPCAALLCAPAPAHLCCAVCPVWFVLFAPLKYTQYWIAVILPVIPS